jgi:predicted ABC-class ATPase
MTAREVWCTSQEYFPAGNIITMDLHAQILPGVRTIGPLVDAVQRRKSHPIEIISEEE